MIELPEATIIANQLNTTLQGKRITSAVRGNVPHKFAFYSRSAEEYTELLTGRTVGEAIGHGNAILVPILPAYTLVLGGGGERILYHQGPHNLPRKHHLRLDFADGTTLTVTVQGWGNVLLLDDRELHEHPHVGRGRVGALSNALTFDRFASLFDALTEEDRSSIKRFLISDPGVWGIGNGYLQDILFIARIHPRRRAIDVNNEERSALYHAIRNTFKQAVDLGGRDSERDLFSKPGGYRRMMDSKTMGQPCPACGTLLEKIQYLGGACYLCPGCQT